VVGGTQVTHAYGNAEAHAATSLARGCAYAPTADLPCWSCTSSEQIGVGYAIGINPVLRRQAAELQAIAQITYEAARHPQRLHGEFRLSLAEGWLFQTDFLRLCRRFDLIPPAAHSYNFLPGARPLRRSRARLQLSSHHNRLQRPALAA